MVLDFDALGGGGKGPGAGVIEPRKIFTTLVRHPRFKFPSANQGEVLDKWFDARNRADNTIKMNTGSGKMLVGLLALKSSLNEGVSPAVYICPDNYLVGQVLNEAKDLGIAATDEPANAAFLSGESILVTNIHKLFNGKSVFGVGEKRIPVGAIVIDDAHACLSVVSEQFRIEVDAEHDVYERLLALFEEDLKGQSELGLIELKSGDPRALILAPFWAWYAKREQALAILHDNRADEALAFRWPLLKEVVQFSQCAFGGHGLEIASRCLPIDRIPSFATAKRRIYMTATLADDGVLVSQLAADAQSVIQPIRPKGAGEIGDRMIIAPQEVNDQITDDDVKALAVEVAKSKNVAVIVPSDARANYWRPVAGQVLMSSNIAAGVEKLKGGAHMGITVLVNRYDGVDLPEDACRLLIIDGLPEVQGLIDRVEANLLEGTDAYLLRQVQRLEQGMGRGVRSEEDRCAVLLLGSRLVQRINLPSARAMFTPATLVQMDLGRAVTQQVKGKPAVELLPILGLCMDRNTEDGVKWWQAGRARLAQAPEGQAAHIDGAVIRQRAAFDLLVAGQAKAAEQELQTAVNAQSDKMVRGYLRQQLAEIVNVVDPAQAQQILLSAVSDNRRVIKPLAGITHVRITAPAKQAAASSEAMSSRFVDANALVLFCNALADDLVWDKDRTDRFEAAIRDLGHLVGFGSQRPDKEYRDGGPDNLWAVGGLHFLVIECKSGVENDGRMIAKDHCNQLLGAHSWFKKNYDASCSSTPILVHPNHKFQKEASPSQDMRILDDERLTNLRKAIRGLGAAVASTGGFHDADVAQKLDQFAFTSAKFVGQHTRPFTTQPG